ncbi:hypothetical protein [Sphingomonas mollis]|uniref:Uncharacterized protein n=1 Tax=Sphingomonas mollis TaxID=2795726 RepID=A0ABS0XLJ1_9SPHN|nr:hypothetical protein [Sphingomonas sp. BT553]MBJ6120899.1 hypothetical protein [Sphingomonas sp. BT553]
MYGGSGTGANGYVFPGGNLLWQAKRNVAAGADIAPGDGWQEIVGNAAMFSAARKWLGKRSVDVWTIAKNIFGATAFAARFRPTICGQARTTTLDHLADELNVSGFMDIVRSIGNSAYSYDNFPVESTEITADSMYQGFVDDMNTGHPARIGQWNDAVLRAGKENYWYELGLHPNIYTPGASNQYKNAWSTLSTQGVRLRELDRLHARNMRERTSGAAFYFLGFFGNVWALRPNGYTDTTSPRWLGHKDGLTA